VLVAIKIAPTSGLNPASALFAHRCLEIAGSYARPDARFFGKGATILAALPKASRIDATFIVVEYRLQERDTDYGYYEKNPQD
jgi:hypothetical protein